jgi:hypothetical protein
MRGSLRAGSERQNRLIDLFHIDVHALMKSPVLIL